MSVDTIVALATPPGRGGVGIVRLSGPDALGLAYQISNHKILEARLATYSSFYTKSGAELLDQGLILYFKAPHSFTGEDVVEFQTHGSPVVLDLLIKECLDLGARMAKPGEFSERAFLNDKMDLTQAEAIADLIQCSSQTAAHMALRTLQGEFSAKINQLNEQIIYLRLYVEASIDFPEEEVDFLSDGTVNRLFNAVLHTLNNIRHEAQQGVLLREGLTLVIAGRPNAGKSTLINTLAGKDIAIVTDIPGTTRDVMREHILLDDLPLHIIDTAGLRESDDIIEQEGIKRAWNELKQADCVLLVVDVQDQNQDIPLTQELNTNLPPDIPIITVLNKMDTLELQPQAKEGEVYLSAKFGNGMEELKSLIKKMVGYQPLEGRFLARRRHLNALDQAKHVLSMGKVQWEAYNAGELLAEDLRLAHHLLGEITGEFTSDDLLGKIFSSFCIGK